MFTIQHQSISLLVFFLIGNPLNLLSQALGDSTINSLSVNFISIGSGVDYKAQEKFTRYLTTFQKDNQVRLDLKSQSWGKEGETKYIIDLTTLPKKQRKILVDALTEMFKDNKLVQLGVPPRS